MSSEEEGREGNVGLSDDSLFHVFLRLDLVSTAAASQVCRKWRGTIASVWSVRVMDIEELLRACNNNSALAQKRFAALASAGVCRPGQLKLARGVLPGSFLFHLRHAFADNLRELDMSGVQVTNADLFAIPTHVYRRLRRLVVAPEDAVISILSLAPVAAACQTLRHIRWSGFVVLKAALLAELLRKNTGLAVLQIEAHPRGWRLQNEHLRTLTQATTLGSLSQLSLCYGQFDGATLEPLLQLRGSLLTRLSLEGCFVAGKVGVCALVAKYCMNLEGTKHVFMF
jgi:hypothetical protein